jgi:site-specific recombinase
VYRARDTHLGRSVAIKILPAAFSADRDGLHRFGILLVGLLNIFTSFMLSFLLAVRARDIGEAKARRFLKEVG